MMEVKEVKMRVRCNWCGWEGTEDDLKIISDDTSFGIETCPACGKGDCLMDLNWDEVYGNRGDGND